jgi:hypothetical protein
MKIEVFFKKIGAKLGERGHGASLIMFAGKLQFLGNRRKAPGSVNNFSFPLIGLISGAYLLLTSPRLLGL